MRTRIILTIAGFVVLGALPLMAAPDCTVNLDYNSEAVCLNQQGEEVSTQYWTSMEQAVETADETIESTNSKMQNDISKQQDQADKGKTINLAVGAALAAAGATSCGQTCYIMSGMTVANAIANEQYIAEADLTQNELTNVCDAIDGGSACAVRGDTDGIANLESLLSGNPQLNDIRDKLKEDGISLDFNKKTITTPKGTFPMENANSKSGFKKMGFGSGEADLAFDSLKKAEKKAYASVSRMALGGGGGGSGSSSSSNRALDDLFDSLINKQMRKRARKPASKKGQKKLVAGEAIGVKGDDIFEMIHRRYKIKSQTKNFFAH